MLLCQVGQRTSVKGITFIYCDSHIASRKGLIAAVDAQCLELHHEWSTYNRSDILLLRRHQVSDFLNLLRDFPKLQNDLIIEIIKHKMIQIKVA